MHCTNKMSSSTASSRSTALRSLIVCIPPSAKCTNAVAWAAHAAAIAATDVAASSSATPRATITVAMTSSMLIEWNDDDWELHRGLQGGGESTTEISPTEQPAAGSKTVPISTGGLLNNPLIRGEDKTRLRKLGRKIRSRVRNSIKQAAQTEERNSQPAIRPMRYHDGETVSENRPTESMYPIGDEGYARAPQDGSRRIYRSLSRACASSRVVRRYKDTLRLLPTTEVKPGLVGMGCSSHRK